MKFEDQVKGADRRGQEVAVTVTESNTTVEKQSTGEGREIPEDKTLPINISG